MLPLPPGCCPSLQVEIERALPQFRGDECAGQLDDLLRICLRLHAEMAHITTNLQYYINLEVVECEQQLWILLLLGDGCERILGGCMHLGIGTCSRCQLVPGAIKHEIELCSMVSCWSAL